ncbi:MAG: hypothetical protein ABI858_09500, partial [Pseudoxanthomonas sp.]
MRSSVFKSLALLGLAIGLSFAHADERAQPSEAAGDAYEYYEIGDRQAPTPGKVEPGLMLMGGGEWAKQAFRWMADRSG